MFDFVSSKDYLQIIIQTVLDEMRVKSNQPLTLISNFVLILFVIMFQLLLFVPFLPGSVHRNIIIAMFLLLRLMPFLYVVLASVFVLLVL